MTETTVSPRYHRQSFSRPNAPIKTPSHGHNMPPLVSPRISAAQESSSSHVRTPSPNYFGFHAGGNSSSFAESPHNHAKRNWSPPSSTVRSTAAISPSIVPHDQNPEFEAFRKKSLESKAFNLDGLGGNFRMAAPPAMQRSGRPARKTPPAMEEHAGRTSTKDNKAPSRAPHQSSQSLDPATADLGRSPKRMLSPGSAMFGPDVERRMSPASFTDGGEIERPQTQARFKLPLDNTDGPFGMLKMAKAETLSTSTVATDSEASLMVSPQYVLNLIDSKEEQYLLLDLRVSTQYADAHIAGALNLCIPTTLLKRPSFNVQKLAETFKDISQKTKFEKWKNSTFIVVYDAASSQLKDAQICLNTIKKFRSEGYEGQLYIIKGGFADFSRRFSSYVARGADSPSKGSSAGVDSDGPEIAPVVGGCPMPLGDKPANPFFGNIRQNMDLIGGVGQIALKQPANATRSVESEYPEWLRKAAEERDQGKKVSGKFEQIERREKKRMEDALSGKVAWHAKTPKEQQAHLQKTVQIAGIEKGSKNRYNNIWPFEHSRVRLQGVPSNECDYFNANFIKAAWSNKRYISTQAPIPATFNDFWNVVWQQDVRVIVMLTAEKEGAQVKAHNYWDQRQYGPFHLEFLSEKRASIEPSRIHKHQQKRPGIIKRTSTTSSNPQIPLAPLDAKDEKAGEQPYVTVRKFTLAHGRKPFEPMREITQLQYSSWPDFGAPAHPAHLLGLVEQTDAVVRATSKSGAPTQSSHSGRPSLDGRRRSYEPELPDTRPVMVHCSAGCGRTGTFCTVDSVVDMLKRQRLSQEEKSASAMDIDDRSSPFRNRGATPKAAPSKGAEDDFFGSQGRGLPDEDDAETIDGDWVCRRDIDLVEKTVEDFRHQRISMVQSLRQYVLCYESVMEWIAEHRG